MSIDAKLSRLSLNLKNVANPDSQGRREASTTTPDSWEDVDDDDTPVEAPGPTLKQITSHDRNPGPPPPTPISPSRNGLPADYWSTGGSVDADIPTSRLPQSPRDISGKRPETTTATANRLIAGALGIKAPKKTEEQRKYDRAVKEAEIKRNNRQKEDKERDRLEEEKAKAAVWDA